MNATNESSDLPEPKPPATQSTRPGWFQRHFNRHALIRFAIIVGILLLIVALFYQEEKVRGRRAWERYKQELASQGIPMEVKAVLPPPISPEQNFARTPLLKPIYESASRQVRNENDPARRQLEAKFKCLEEVAYKLGFILKYNYGGSWRSTQWPNPEKMLVKYKMAADKSTLDSSNSGKKAAEQVLDLFQQTTGQVLDELQAEISVHRYSNFDINWDTDEPQNVLLPYLWIFKSLGQQSTTRAMAALYLNKSDDGFRDTLFALRCSETLKDKPIVVDLHMRIALREIAINPVWYGLATRQWNATQINQLQSCLVSVDSITEVRKALNFERITTQRTIDDIAKRFPGEILFSDLFGYMGTDELQPISKTTEKLLSQLYPKGWFYFESINYQKAFLNYVLHPIPSSQIRLDLTAYQAGTDELSNKTRAGNILLNKRMAVFLLIPPITQSLETSARNQMACTLAATACALERYRLDHGVYPKQLADLVPQYLKAEPFDYMSGQTLKYQLKADGTFLLYSFGRNGVDDGGNVVLKTSGAVDQNEGDWVWQYPSTPANP